MAESIEIGRVTPSGSIRLQDSPEGHRQFATCGVVLIRAEHFYECEMHGWKFCGMSSDGELIQVGRKFR